MDPKLPAYCWDNNHILCRDKAVHVLVKYFLFFQAWWQKMLGSIQWWSCKCNAFQAAWKHFFIALLQWIRGPEKWWNPFWTSQLACQIGLGLLRAWMEAISERNEYIITENAVQPLSILWYIVAGEDILSNIQELRYKSISQIDQKDSKDYQCTQ